MQSPVRGIRFIHLAIQREVEQLETAAWSGQIGGWAERAARLGRIVDLHTKSEEASLFADLAERLPESASTYLFDHVEEQWLFAEATTAARGGDVDNLRKHASVLRAHVSVHIRKEEELVLPLLEKLFSMQELGLQVGRMMATFPPGEMLAALPWIVERLDPDDRVAYMSMLRKVTPAEKLLAIVGAVRGGLPEPLWSELSRRMPDLPG